MKAFIGGLCVMIAAAAPVLAQQGRPDAAADAIRQVVADYNRGLNGCDIEGIVRVFEPDAIWMPPNQPAAEGEQGLRAWFKNYCSRTVAKLNFMPVEVQRTGDWAWVRVNVTGTTTIKAGGTVTPQENKALFIIRQGAGGMWRIARYTINSNKPAVVPQR